MLATIDGVGGGGIASRTLLSIAETAIAERFRCWRGASGRRYTVSVFPVDALSPDRGLPDFDGCVVIPVGEGETRLGARAVEDFRDARTLRAAAAGVREWHVHLLAADAAARAAAAADLSRRPD